MTDENRMTLSILVQDGDFVQSYRCASRQAAVDLVRHLAAEHPAHELREEIVDPVALETIRDVRFGLIGGGSRTVASRATWFRGHPTLLPAARGAAVTPSM